MSKFLDGTGLTDLLNKIKSAFVAKTDTAVATVVDIDSTPTANSSNLVTSGGVYTSLSGKQATISDLTTIRSGAALGATAVQPGDLATVAASGSYNDLSDTPTIPTITFRQW